MSECDDKPKKKGIIERVIFNNFDFFNLRNDAEEILSADLDHHDWHLKYARNIINLILFISASILTSSITGWSFTDFTLDDLISRQMQIFCLCVVVLIGFVCAYFDEMHDQESAEVWWFTHLRFWAVTLSLGGLTIFIAVKVLSISGI